MAGQLIVSVSSVRAQTLDDAVDFSARMTARAVPLSWFVAPRGTGHQLERESATVAWLTQRRTDGDALVLHGYDEAAAGRRLRDEFAALPAHEANLRLMAADRILDHVGLRTRLFAAPNWTASEGVLRVLPRNGFRLYVGATGVHDLVRDAVLRARVLGIGSGFGGQSWWCRTVVLSAERIARRGGTVRLAVSGRQLRKPAVTQALCDAVDLALMHGAVPTVYSWAPDPGVARAA